MHHPGQRDASHGPRQSSDGDAVDFHDNFFDVGWAGVFDINKCVACQTSDVEPSASPSAIDSQRMVVRVEDEKGP